MDPQTVPHRQRRRQVEHDLAGSCTAVAARHGANPADSPWSRPHRPTVSVSSTPPAWPTAAESVEST